MICTKSVQDQLCDYATYIPEMKGHVLMVILSSSNELFPAKKSGSEGSRVPAEQLKYSCQTAMILTKFYPEK